MRLKILMMSDLQSGAEKVEIVDAATYDRDIERLKLTIENIKAECVAGRCDEKTFAISERILSIARSSIIDGGAEHGT